MASLSRKIKRVRNRRKSLDTGATATAPSLDRSAMRLCRLGAGAAGALVLLAAPSAMAGDGFTKVVSGDTTIFNQTAQKVYNITESYNIAAHQSHIYNQPGLESIFVQRVVGQDPSSILGSLVANGQVWIMNPSGVLIGSTARVNTGGFMATSLVMDRDDFFAGRYQLKQEGAGGFVINEGAITVNNGGSVVLAGASVVNNGYISADMGEVVLAAGRKATFDFTGDGLINFAVDGDVAARVTGPDGAEITSAALNTGQIQGAKVVMTAKAARDIFSSVVNNEGMIEATRVEVGAGGEIQLLGGSQGDVVNFGTLKATGDNASVQVAGERIGNAGLIQADGGSVKLDSIDQVVLMPGSVIQAYGGEVRVNAPDADGNMADSTTMYEGALIDAGDGFVEVSGKYLDVDAGTIQAGTVLFDPLNIILQYGGADNNTAGFVDVPPWTMAWNTQAGNTTTFNTDGTGILSSVGAGGTIILEALQDISVVGNFNLQTATGDSDVSLELRAGQHIQLTIGSGPAPGLWAGSITADGTGSITLLADYGFPGQPSDGVGLLVLAGGAPVLTSENGDIVISSANETILPVVNVTGTGNVDVTITHGTVHVKSTTTQGGDVTITAGIYAVGAVETEGPVVTNGGDVRFYASDQINHTLGGTIDTRDAGGDGIFAAYADYNFSGVGGLASNGSGEYVLTNINPGVGVHEIFTGSANVTISAAGSITLTGSISTTGKVFLTSSQRDDDLGVAVGGYDWEIGATSISNIVGASDITIGQFTAAEGAEADTGIHTGNIIVGNGNVATANLILRTSGNILDDGISDTGITANTIQLLAVGPDSYIGTFARPVGVDAGAGTVTADTSLATSNGDIHLEEITRTPGDLDFSQLTITTNAAYHKTVSLHVVPDGANSYQIDVDVPTDWSAQDLDLILVGNNPNIANTLNIGAPGTGNNLIIMPFSANQPIYIGPAPAGPPAQFSIVQAELDNIFADGLTIGRANAGNVWITGDAAIGYSAGLGNQDQIHDWTIITGQEIKDDGLGAPEVLTLTTSGGTGTLTLDAGTGINGSAGTNNPAVDPISAANKLQISTNGFLSARNRTGGHIYLYQADGNNTVLNDAQNVNTWFDPTSNFGAHIWAPGNVAIETTGSLTNLNVSAAQGGKEGIKANDLALYADGGIGTTAAPIVTDVAGQLAAVNTTSGGIFIQEGTDGGNLTIGTAEIVSPALRYFSGVTNLADDDVEIYTTNGNLTVAANFWVQNDFAAGNHIVLGAGQDSAAALPALVPTLTLGDNARVFTDNGDINLYGDDVVISVTGGNEATVNTMSDGTGANYGDMGGGVYAAGNWNNDGTLGDVYISTATAGRNVVVGGGGGLSLTQGELRRIFTPHSFDIDNTATQTDPTTAQRGVVIGYLGAGQFTADQQMMDGTITVGGAVDLSGSSYNTPWTNNIALVTSNTAANAINDGTAGLTGQTITANQFYAEAGGGIDVTLAMVDESAVPNVGTGARVNALSTGAGNIVIDNNGAAPHKLFVDDTWFLNPTSLALANGNGINNLDGAIVLQSNTGITNNGDIFSNGNGFVVVEVDAAWTAGPPAVDLENNGGIVSWNDAGPGGEVHLIADGIELNPGSFVDSWDNNNVYLKPFNAATTVEIGGAGPQGAAVLHLTEAELETIGVFDGVGVASLTHGLVIGTTTSALDAADGTITNYSGNSNIQLMGPVDLSDDNGYINIALATGGAISDDGAGLGSLQESGNIALMGSSVTGTSGAGAADRLHINAVDITGAIAGTVTTFTAGVTRVESTINNIRIVEPIAGFTNLFNTLGGMAASTGAQSNTNNVVFNATNGDVIVHQSVLAAGTAQLQASRDILVDGILTDRTADTFVQANNVILVAGDGIGDRAPYDNPVYIRANNLSATAGGGATGTSHINIYQDDLGGAGQNLTITSLADLVAGAGSIDGVTMTDATSVAPQGYVTVTNIEGNLTLLEDVTSATDGTITLTAGWQDLVGGGSTSRMIAIGTGVSPVLVDNVDGLIYLYADNLNIATAAGNEGTVGDNAETTFVMPVNWSDAGASQSTLIVLGGVTADAQRLLSITTAEAQRFQSATGTLIIGYDGTNRNMNNIDLGAAFPAAPAGNADFSNVNTVHLYAAANGFGAAGDIKPEDPNAQIITTNLALTASGLIDVRTQVVNVAANGEDTSPGIRIIEDAAGGDLVVPAAGVDGVIGINGTTGPIEVRAENGNLTVSANIGYDEAQAAGLADTVTLVAAGQNNQFTLDNGAWVVTEGSTDANRIDVWANNLDLQNAGGMNAGAGVIAINTQFAGTAIEVGSAPGVDGANDTMEIAFSELAKLWSTTRVELRTATARGAAGGAGADIYVTDAAGEGAAQAYNFSTLILDSADSIWTDWAAPNPDFYISVDNLGLLAGQDIAGATIGTGPVDPFSTAQFLTDSLVIAAQNAQNDIFIENVRAAMLTIGVVTADAGLIEGVTTLTNGAIGIANMNDGISIDAHIISNGAAGDIAIVGDWNAVVGGDVILNAGENSADSIIANGGANNVMIDADGAIINGANPAPGADGDSIRANQVALRAWNDNIGTDASPIAIHANVLGARTAAGGLLDRSIYVDNVAAGGDLIIGQAANVQTGIGTIDGVVTSGGAGDDGFVRVRALDGNLTVTQNVTATGNGTVLLEAWGDLGDDHWFNHTGGVISSTNQDITIVADRMNLATGAPNQIHTTPGTAGGNVILRPYNAAINVELGGNILGGYATNDDPAGTMRLIEEELGTINTNAANGIIVGDATGLLTGTIHLIADLNLYAPFGAGNQAHNIAMKTANETNRAIWDGTDGLTGFTITANQISAQTVGAGGGNIDLTSMMTAGNLVSASTVGTNANIIWDDNGANGLDTSGATFDGQSGITTVDGHIVIQTNADFTAGAGTNISAGWGSATPRFLVVEVANNVNGQFTRNAGGTFRASGDIHLIADGMTINDTVEVPSGQSIWIIPYDPGNGADIDTIRLGMPGFAVDNLDLTAAELANLNVNGGGSLDAVVIGRGATATAAANAAVAGQPDVPQASLSVALGDIIIMDAIDLSGSSSANYSFVTDGAIYNDTTGLVSAMNAANRTITINGVVTLDAENGIGVLQAGLGDDAALNQDYADWFSGTTNEPIMLRSGDGSLTIAARNGSAGDIAIAMAVDPALAETNFVLGRGINGSVANLWGVRNSSSGNDIALWVDPAVDAIYNPSGSLGVGVHHKVVLHINEGITATDQGRILIDAGIGQGADSSFIINSGDPNAEGDTAKGGSGITQASTADIVSGSGNIWIIAGDDDDTDATSMIDNDLEFLIGYIETGEGVGGGESRVTIRFDGNVRDNNGGGVNIRARALTIDNAPEFNDEFGAGGDEIELEISAFTADAGSIYISNSGDLEIEDPNLDGDNNPETWFETAPGNPQNNAVGVRARQGGITINVGVNNLVVNGVIMARTDDTHLVPNAPVPGADIRLVADTIEINASIIAGGYDPNTGDTGNITIEPLTSSQPIFLGHDPEVSVAGLGLTQRELNFLRTDENATITIGQRGGTGAVTIGWTGGSTVHFDNQVVDVDDSTVWYNPVLDPTVTNVYGDRNNDGIVDALDLTEGPANALYRFGSIAQGPNGQTDDGTEVLAPMPNVTIYGGTTTFNQALHFYSGKTFTLELTGAVIDNHNGPDTAEGADIVTIARAWDAGLGAWARTANSTGAAIITAVGGIGDGGADLYDFTDGNPLETAVHELSLLNKDKANSSSDIAVVNFGSASAGLLLNGAVNMDGGAAKAASALFGGDLFVRANEGGAAGNNITLEIIDGGVGGLAVIVIGNDIQIDLGGDVVTDADIAAAINADVAASALVNAVGGADPASLQAATNLAGGGNAGNIKIQSRSPLTVNADVINVGSGGINLEATESGLDTDDLTIMQGVYIGTDSGDIRLSAGDDILVAGNGTNILIQTGGAGNILLEADTAGTTGGIIDLVGTGAAVGDNADALIRQQGTGNVTLDGRSDVTVSKIVAGNDVLVQSNTGSVYLVGAIKEQSGVFTSAGLIDAGGAVRVNALDRIFIGPDPAVVTLDLGQMTNITAQKKITLNALGNGIVLNSDTAITSTQDSVDILATVSTAPGGDINGSSLLVNAAWNIIALGIDLSGGAASGDTAGFDAGSLSLVTQFGDIFVGDITTVGSDGNDAGLGAQAGGAGGSVYIKAGRNASVVSITTNGGNASVDLGGVGGAAMGGDAGDVEIMAGQNISSGDIFAQGGWSDSDGLVAADGPDGGDITLTAGGLITLNDSDFDGYANLQADAGFETFVPPGLLGNAGVVTINGETLANADLYMSGKDIIVNRDIRTATWNVGDDYGSYGVTISNTTTIVLNGNISTANVTGFDTAADNTITTGTISLDAETGIVGNGRLITGNAAIAGSDAGNDAVTSGDIFLLVLNGSVALTADNALTVGSASGNNNADTVVTAGSINIIANSVGTGVPGQGLDVSFGKARFGSTNNAGVINVTTMGGAGYAGEISLTSGEDLVVGDLVTDLSDPLSSQFVTISTTGFGALTLAGFYGADLETDVFDLSTQFGALTVDTDITGGSFDIATQGGNVVVNATLATADVTVASTAGDDAAVSGSINITAANAGALTGTGTIQTGNAIVDAAGGGLDTADSGSITVNVGGTITGLAFVTGDATVDNPDGDDIATAGSISLTGDSIGTDTIFVSTDLGTATGDVANNGVLTLASRGLFSAGNIFITSPSDLYLGTVSTNADTLQVVHIQTTGGGDLYLVANNALDDDVLLESDGDVVQDEHLSTESLTIVAAGAIQQVDGDEIFATTNGAMSLTAHGAVAGAAIGTDALTPLNVSVVGGNLTLTTTDVDGSIFVTSTPTINLGVVSTEANTAQTVEITTTGGASDIVVAEASALDALDTVTLTSGRDTLFDASFEAGFVTVNAGRNIDNVGGNESVSSTGAAADLTLTAQGGIGVSASPLLVSATGNLVLTTAGADAAGDIYVSSANNVNLETITTDGATAQTVRVATTGATDITVVGAQNSNDNLTLAAGQSVLVDEDITTTGTLTLTAATGEIDRVTGDELLTAPTMTLTAATGIGLAGGLDVVTATLTASTSGAGADIIINDNAATAAVTATLTTTGVGADIAYYQSGGQTLALTATTVDGDIGAENNASITATLVTAGGAGSNLDLTTTAGDITLVQAAAGDTAFITAAGQIIDGGDAAIDLTATNAVLTAGTGIGDNGGAGAGQPFALETAVTNLSAQTTSGDIALRNTGALTIVGPGVAILAGNADNDIRIGAASPLTVNAAVTNNGGGNIGLAAFGNTVADDLTINAAVSATGGNGNISLVAGHDILVNADVTAANAGNVAAFAGEDWTDGLIDQDGHPQGDIVQANGTLIGSGTGVIVLDAARNVTVANATTGGNVNIIARRGAVIDGGDAALDVTADVLTIAAATGVGNLNALE
ncbi:MAG: filamentous hemagglutinin N-terminal domain-containing protein, partial [Desulfatibacillaceae bacterium]|nr:filamentous hemagglutinin N-terminal domain-containing protein [Desulfatibacillaceae bacterium]